MKMKSIILNLNSAITLSVFELQSKVNSPVNKKMVRFCTMLMTAVMCMSMVFATGTGTFDALIDQVVSLYTDLLPVFNVCALLFGVCFIAIGSFSSDPQTSRFGQQAAKKVVIGWLIICMFPWILTKAYKLLGGLTNTSTDTIKNITNGGSKD